MFVFLVRNILLSSDFMHLGVVATIPNKEFLQYTHMKLLPQYIAILVVLVHLSTIEGVAIAVVSSYRCYENYKY